MRSWLSAPALLLPALVAADAASSACLQSQELVEATGCGDKALLRECFSAIAPEDPLTRDSIESCLIFAGCESDETTLDSTLVLDFCNRKGDELRRRYAGVEAQDTLARADDVITTTTTANVVSKTAAPAATVPSTTVTHAAAAHVAPRDTATTTADSSLVCKTASETLVSSCAQTNKYDCHWITTTTSVCAAGLFCTVDSEGGDICMVRQDGLTTSGAIVTIFLGVVMAIIMGTLIVLCCHDRAQQKRIRAQAEAAAIAKENLIQKRPEASIAARQARGGNPFGN